MAVDLPQSNFEMEMGHFEIENVFSHCVPVIQGAHEDEGSHL